MKDHLQPHKISLSTFKRVLAKYDDYIPEKLSQLEQLRLKTIPDAITNRARDHEEDGAYIEKGEFKNLVEWKLYEKDL